MLLLSFSCPLVNAAKTSHTHTTLYKVFGILCIISPWPKPCSFHQFHWARSFNTATQVTLIDLCISLGCSQKNLGGFGGLPVILGVLLCIFSFLSHERIHLRGLEPGNIP